MNLESAPLPPLPAVAKSPIRVLLVENSALDTEQILVSLRNNGLNPVWKRVETIDSLRSALTSESWDCVTSAYTLPGFGGPAALELVRTFEPDLPFIIVSETVGEDAAVELMRSGANDYVRKLELARLAPAIEREIETSRIRRAKRTAEQANALLAAIVESSDDAILSITVQDGTITSWNSAAERLYGWSRVEAIGRNISFFVPDDQTEALNQIMIRLRAGQPIEYFETVRLHRDGSRIDVSMTISQMRDANGQIIGISKTTRDIRERKRAEAALEQSDKLLRLFIQNVPLPIAMFDHDMRYLFVSRQWVKTYHLENRNLIGVSHYEIFPETPHDWKAIHQRCLAGETHRCEEARFERADGTVQWLRWEIHPWLLATGEPGGITMFTEEISDRKHAQEAFTLSEMRYRRLFEAAKDGILIVDATSRQILDANPFMIHLLGYSREELLGKELWEIGLFGDIESSQVAFRTLQETGYIRYDGLPLQTRDGRRIEVEFISNVYSDHGTQVAQCNIREFSDHRQAQEAVRASEAKFRAFMDHSPAASFIKDKEGRYTYVNPTWRRQFNPELIDWYGKTDHDLWPKETADLFHASDVQCLSRNTVVQSEESGKSLSGEECTWMVMKFPLSSEGPQQLGGMAWDISDRKRAEQKFRLFRSLVDQTTDSIEVIDPESGQFLDVNEAACASHGYTREEYLKLNVMDVADPAGPRSWNELSHGRQSGIVPTVESRHRRRDGSLFPVEINLNFVQLERNYLVAVVRDITERKRAEAALHLRDRAIAGATQGLVIADACLPDVPLVYVSPGFERITGYPAEEILGRNCRFLHGRDTDPAVVSRIREAILTGQPFNAELLNYRKDGTSFWNELSISPIWDASGGLTHFVGVQSDVTERRKLEEQFRQAQKMEAVGQLAGGIAHDFNNLLTIINGYSDLLLMTLPKSDPSRESISEIHKAGSRSADLTRQLLAFSRKQILAPKILDLNAVVTNTRNLLHRLIGEDIRLTITLGHDLWLVKADPGQIDQVLMNLAVNARDAMPTGGRLTIETQNVELDIEYVRSHPDARVGEYVLVSVADNGSGMPPEVLAKIFDPFFTTKEIGKGTGLGLATVYGIVRQSEGIINVYSEPGIGTTFKVYLPRIVPGPVVRKSPSVERLPPRGNETILIAEDEAGVRALTRRILTDCGYKVLEAADGEEAIRIAMQYTEPIHLLVTDVVMPGAGGRIVAEQLANQHPEMRVLFLSGYTDDAIVRHGVLREGVNFLQKPFSPVSLARKTREVLDKVE